MRRIVFSLLTLLLSFQFTWAAAAAYCGHEASGPAGQHFGHHEHRHEAGKKASERPDAAGTLLAHADCASCQLGSAAPIVALPSSIGALVVPAGPPAAAPDTFRSHIPSLPERPDRRIA